MPTLRVELLKSREEDDFIVEKRVVHSNRVSYKVVAGYPQHASKLKKCNPTEPKQAKERLSMGKALGITSKKLSSSEAHGSLVASYRAQTPQSPSESDSFSIRSSSSSCKSEADSIKKPSPPTSLVKPNAASLHMNLGSYFGDLSKAIHEKFQKEETRQNGFLEFQFSEGRMVDTVRQKMNEGKVKELPYVDLKGGRILGYDSSEMAASGVATPTFHTVALTRSPETSVEASHHSGDPCSAPFPHHDLNQSKSIKKLTVEREEGGILCDEQCQTDAHNREGYNGTCISQAPKQEESAQPFEADVSIDTVLAKAVESNPICSTQIEKRPAYPRTVSCHLPRGKHEEGFSFQVSPYKDIPMQETSSCWHTPVDPSTYPGVVSIQGKPACAKVCLEKYIFSTPLMVGNDAPNPPSHEDRCNYTEYTRSLSSALHVHSFSRKLTRSHTSAVTPPPSVEEPKGKANFDELTPVSPLSLSEASARDMFGEEFARDHPDMVWFATSNAEGGLNHPSKAHWDWRSKSIGARASLKSAVRNLEAAFGGSRSVSLPKTRSQTSERERKSESSKFINRVFVSPAKIRHKGSEGSKQSTQRLSYSGSQVPEDLMRRGMRRDANCNRSGWDNAGSNHCMIPPSLPPLHKHPKKSGTADFKVSTIPFLPSSRSVHSLAPLKDLPGHISPSVSTPPSSALSRVTMPASRIHQGYLQCFERDGTTCYTLSLKDSEEILLAKACSFAHNLSKEGCKCMYTFQSGRSKNRGKGTNGWKSWLKKDGKFTTDLAGKMQVSSELCSGISPTGKRLQFLVLEFVLYDERNDDSTRSQSLRFLSSSNGCHNTCTPAESPLSVRSMYEFAQSAGLAKKQVPHIPRSPSSAMMSSKLTSISHNPQPCSPVKKGTPVHHPCYSIDIWSDSDVAEHEVRREGSYSTLHSELAAIVIKMPMNEDGENNHQFSNGACRRSLNFSDDQTKAPRSDCRNRSVLDATLDAATSPGTKQGLPTGTPSSGCVTMMLPKEHHGLPKGGVHGPTSLIDRWRGGGKCDCGGWDLGCGMKVFSTQRCEKLAAAADCGNSIQSISHKQPLILYSQEGKTQEVLLSVSLVQEGYFILKFHNELSPLKAFATAVAILHSRESSSSKGRLMPIVKANQQYQSDPETIGRSSNRLAFLEVYNDIPTWFPSDRRSPSPFGRA